MISYRKANLLKKFSFCVLVNLRACQSLKETCLSCLMVFFNMHLPWLINLFQLGEKTALSDGRFLLPFWFSPSATNSLKACIGWPNVLPRKYPSAFNDPSSMTHKTCHLSPFHGPAQPNALWPVKLPFPDLLELSQPEDVAMENAKLQPGTLQLHKRNHLSTPTSYRKIPCLSLFGYGFSFFAAAPKLNTSHKTHTHT